MGFLGKIIVRIVFCVAILVIITSGVVGINNLYEIVQAVMMIFALVSADILIERYLSPQKGDTE